jgi:hypothetical protein
LRSLQLGEDACKKFTQLNRVPFGKFNRVHGDEKILGYGEILSEIGADCGLK